MRLNIAGSQLMRRFNILYAIASPTIVVIVVLLTALAGVAGADDHKVTLIDATVCSDNLNVQHIRVSLNRDGENVWNNCVEFRFLDGSATQVDQFLVTNNPLPGTEGTVFDIGTTEWSIANGIPLDVTIPSGNVMDPNGTVCYHGLPSCDEVEFCVAVTSLTCGTGPVCGNGTVESGEQCDDGGTGAGDCCSPTCQFEPAATECRASSGVCDIAEFCDGSTATCPADVLAPATTECNPAAGVCDVAEFCDGSTATCSADLKSTAECRAAVGACDLAEACDGLADACPADLFDPALCDDGTYCNGTETCNAGICEPGTPPSCSGATPWCDEVLENCAECLVDLDCNDGGVCNGPEICAGGACGPGTAATCGGSTLLCDNTLASCIECLNDTDCTEGFVCGVGVCQPPPSVPALSPQLLAWLALSLCTVAVATLRRPPRERSR